MIPVHKLTPVSSELFEYMESACPNVHPILVDIVSKTASLPDAVMQIPKHQGAFMHMLVKLIGASRAIEVGCYTGYSAVSMASALPANGTLATFDIDPKTSAMAVEFFSKAGLSHIVELVLGSAEKTLAEYVARVGEGSIDFAFIDADKVRYDCYYELCLKALRPGGLMLVDNMFRDGEIIAPAVKDLGTQAVFALTTKIKSDDRVMGVMIPVADGLMLVRKS